MTAVICEVADTLGEVVKQILLSGNLHGASIYKIYAKGGHVDVKEQSSN